VRAVDTVQENVVIQKKL